MEASSTWKLTGNSECDTIEKERTANSLLKIGTSVAIPYSFHGDVFGSWIATVEEENCGPNYLGILTIGWCYILSARLLDIHGDGASMEYTTSKVAHYPDAETIDVGEVDKNITRWWYAILDEGWKAIVKRTSKKEFLTRVSHMHVSPSTKRSVRQLVYIHLQPLTKRLRRSSSLRCCITWVANSLLLL